MTLLFLALIFAVIALAIVLPTLGTGISPMPSSVRMKRRLLEVLEPPGDGVIYELGAGWGGLALSLARRFPEHRIIALELSPLPWLVALLRTGHAGLPNLSILRGDFFSRPLDDAALVVCYLEGGIMTRLAPKLTRELPPESRIVSIAFALPGHTPVRTVVCDDWLKTPILFYRRPAGGNLPTGDMNPAIIA